MLTAEEIAEVIDKFAKLEAIKKAKAGGGKEGRRGVSSFNSRTSIELDFDDVARTS